MEQIQSGDQELNSMHARSSTSGRSVSRPWRSWIVDATLLFSVLIGACFAWPIQRQAGQLHAKRLDLQRRVGEMPISDPAKYHVLLLKSDNPLEFRWRVYMPAKTAAMVSTEVRSSTGSGLGSSSFANNSNPAFEGLVTASILPMAGNSNLEIRTRTRALSSRGTSTMNLQDEVIQRMVNASDTSSWRIAGKSGVEAFSVEEMIWLLVVEPASQDVAPNKPGLIRVGLGTQAAIDKARAQ